MQPMNCPKNIPCQKFDVNLTFNLLLKRAGAFRNFWTLSNFFWIFGLYSLNIVRGLTKNPRVKTLHKIALAFNMTLAEFLDFSELNEYSFDEDDSEE